MLTLRFAEFVFFLWSSFLQRGLFENIVLTCAALVETLHLTMGISKIQHSGNRWPADAGFFF